MSDETDYQYMMHDGKKLQVESAVRDSQGYKIATTYPKKVDIFVRPASNQRIIIIHHGLDNAPSSVSLYLVHHTDPVTYEAIETDITVTSTDIVLNFIELPDAPDAEGLELLVRSLI